MPVAGAFLSNISLFVFVFLIINKETIAEGMLSWLHIPIFAFPLVIIKVWRQQ